MNIKRRSFLKGAGGIVFGLPFLEGLIGKEGFAQSADHRFAILIRQPSGVVQEKFWPKQTGALTQASLNGTALAPLASVASQILVVKGFAHGFPNINCDHSFGGVQAFTAGRPIGNAQSVKSSTESLDNRIARELSPGKEPLALYAAGQNQGRGSDMTSFRGSNDLRTGERSPFNAYKRLFSVASTGVDPLVETRLSVNDYVRQELKELMASPLLSKEDKLRLEMHVDSVRDTEKVIASLSDARVKQLQDGGSATSYGESMPEVIKMHMDVMVLAMATGAAKAGTLQILDIIGETGYRWNNETFPAQHANSHSGGANERAVQAKYDVIHSELFKYLIDGLNKYKIEDKTLLDHGFVLMTSEVGDGLTHSHVDLPTVIAGSGNGFLKQNEFIQISKKTNNKLLNTLGSAVGLKNGNGPLDNFGDSSLEKGLISEMVK
jgi:hypothetical protein